MPASNLALAQSCPTDSIWTTIIGAAQAQAVAPRNPVDAAVGTAGSVVSSVTGGVLQAGRSVGYGAYPGAVDGTGPVDSNGSRPFINGVF